MLQLVLTRNGRPILKKPFEQEKIIIGRGHECEIQLFEPEISRQHCTLTKENGHFVLQDSSRNGTRVNGKKIGQTILHSKDQFEIGPWVIQIAKEEAKSDETVANKRVDARDQLGNMLGGSQAMQAVFEKIRKAAGANVPVAIQGESGTGKELAASLIHQLSARRDKPFVPINCGAIPSNLIESLLFGHEKGAFTGAVERNLGVFEQADQGTLFLDEIGEMPLELQTRLLRVLENGMVKRIGARDEKKVDVRIITATNRDLQDSVRNGAFREDLFFRLHIFPILLPPLRERRREIPTLARHFLETLSANGAEIEIEPASMEKLSRHDWPGNIRELKNTIQRALLLAETKITTNEIEFSFSTSNGNGNGAVASKKDLADQERESIIATIRKARGNHSQACRYLGIARSTLVSKLRRHQIQPQEWE